MMINELQRQAGMSHKYVEQEKQLLQKKTCSIIYIKFKNKQNLMQGVHKYEKNDKEKHRSYKLNIKDCGEGVKRGNGIWVGHTVG